MLKSVFSGIAAGILIGIGATAYLFAQNLLVGGVLFAFAFIGIAYLEMSIFTDKVGLMVDRTSLEDVITLPLMLVGNWIGATAVGVAVAYLSPEAKIALNGLCEQKLRMSYGTIILYAVLCGVLMYVMAKIWDEKKSPIGFILAVPTFLACGFEHSIADIFYFSAAQIFGVRRVLFLTLVVIGNAVGAMLIPLLLSLGYEKATDGAKDEAQTEEASNESND